MASILEELPVGIYTLGLSRSGFILERKESDKFEVIEETYGKLPKLKTKLSADIARHDKLGVMLIGEKGSGKSLLAKQLCNESNLPVIIVKESFDDVDITEFLDGIPNKFILFIDEFEKIFTINEMRSGKETENKQNRLLSLFDGTSQSGLIALLTANSEANISEYFRNRTKRIKYYIEFEALTTSEIKEYIDAKGLGEKVFEKLMNLNFIVSGLNYDVLTEIVDELLVYPEYTISELLEYLNIKVDLSRYDVACFCNKVKDNTGYVFLVAAHDIRCNPYLQFYIDQYSTAIREIDLVDIKAGEDDDREHYISIDKFFKAGIDYSKVTREGSDAVVTLDNDYVDFDGINYGRLKFVFSKTVTKFNPAF
jgi:hypothetical protein